MAAVEATRAAIGQHWPLVSSLLLKVKLMLHGLKEHLQYHTPHKIVFPRCTTWVDDYWKSKVTLWVMWILILLSKEVQIFFYYYYSNHSLRIIVSPSGKPFCHRWKYTIKVYTLWLVFFYKYSYTPFKVCNVIRILFKPGFYTQYNYSHNHLYYFQTFFISPNSPTRFTNVSGKCLCWWPPCQVQCVWRRRLNTDQNAFSDKIMFSTSHLLRVTFHSITPMK